MLSNQIIEQSFAEIMGKRFSDYANLVILSRAIPDARDGLKPVQRRILYAMYQEGNTHDKPYRKSAKTVGYVMGTYHPHGDSAIYETMVRMAQWWKMRQVLIQGHGNFGSLDADPPAKLRTLRAVRRVAGEIIEFLAQLARPPLERVQGFVQAVILRCALIRRIVAVGPREAVFAGRHRTGELLQGPAFRPARSAGESGLTL